MCVSWEEGLGKWVSPPQLSSFHPRAFLVRSQGLSFPALYLRGLPLRVPPPHPRAFALLFPLPITGSPLPRAGEVWGAGCRTSVLTLEDGDKSIPSLLPHPSGLSSQVSSSKRPPEIWEYHITALLPWLRLLLMPRHVTTAIVASSITCVLFHGPAPHGSSCADGLFSQIWDTKG